MRGAWVGATIGLLLALSPHCGGERDDDNLRRDVLTCEDAIAHAKDCCGPEIVAGLQCYYLNDVDESGCSSTKTIQHQDPDLYVDESNCLRDMECGDMTARGICKRLGDLPRNSRQTTTTVPTSSSSVGTTGASHAAVCP
jgi:hypothetical protein